MPLKKRGHMMMTWNLWPWICILQNGGFGEFAKVCGHKGEISRWKDIPVNHYCMIQSKISLLVTLHVNRTMKCVERLLKNLLKLVLVRYVGFGHR